MAQAARSPVASPRAGRPKGTSSPGSAAGLTSGAGNDLGTLTLLLGRVGRLNELLSTEVCQAHDVTLAEVRALAALHDAGEPVRPGVLSDRVVQTSGGLTATLRRLEDDGRIRRIADPTDARVRSVELTPIGEAFVEEMLDAIFSRYADVLGDLDIEESLVLVRALLTRLERATRSHSSADWYHTDR